MSNIEKYLLNIRTIADYSKYYNEYYILDILHKCIAYYMLCLYFCIISNNASKMWILVHVSIYKIQLIVCKYQETILEA